MSNSRFDGTHDDDNDVSPGRPVVVAPSADGRSEPASTSPSGIRADVARAYAELTTIVVGAEPLGAVMRRIAELAVDTIPGADDVSVTVIESGRARSVAFSNNGRLATALDERQYEDGFGPCMDAAMTGQVIEIRDTADNQTYPGFARQAHRLGVTHTLSVGMPMLPKISGALNIYSSGTAGPFEQADHDIATTFAGYASIAVLNAAVYAGALEEVAQMRQAMVSRANIEQAKGIIMRERGCGAEEAFAVLRDLSSTTNRKLRDVAQDVIDTTTRS
jgi:hypothetical protein